MKNALISLTIHVPNVWQTVEWYRQVFGLGTSTPPDTSAACFNVANTSLIFAAHDTQTDAFGSRRLNSFLIDPPAFHLHMATSDVQQLFDHALAHGAVPVLAPVTDAHGQLIASLRDLNGILTLLSQLLPAQQETSN